MFDSAKEKDMYRRLVIDAGVPKTTAYVLVEMYKMKYPFLQPEEYALLHSFASRGASEIMCIKMNALSHKIGRIIEC